MNGKIGSCRAFGGVSLFVENPDLTVYDWPGLFHLMLVLVVIFLCRRVKRMPHGKRRIRLQTNTRQRRTDGTGPCEGGKLGRLKKRFWLFAGDEIGGF